MASLACIYILGVGGVWYGKEICSVIHIHIATGAS